MQFWANIYTQTLLPQSQVCMCIYECLYIYDFTILGEHMHETLLEKSQVCVHIYMNNSTCIYQIYTIYIYICIYIHIYRYRYR